MEYLNEQFNNYYLYEDTSMPFFYYDFYSYGRKCFAVLESASQSKIILSCDLNLYELREKINRPSVID